MMLERWSDAQTGYEWENKNLCAVIASLVKSQSNLNICCPPAAVPSLFLLFFFSLSPPPLCHLIRASITWQRRVVQITGGRWDSEFLEVKLFCGPFSLQCSLFSWMRLFYSGPGLWALVTCCNQTASMEPFQLTTLLLSAHSEVQAIHFTVHTTTQ